MAHVPDPPSSYPQDLPSLLPSLARSLALSPDGRILREKEGRDLAEVNALGRRDGLLDQAPLVVLRADKGERERGEQSQDRLQTQSRRRRRRRYQTKSRLLRPQGASKYSFLPPLVLLPPSLLPSLIPPTFRLFVPNLAQLTDSCIFSVSVCVVSNRQARKCAMASTRAAASA